ncbi:hypothetical protein AB0N09_35680 [Streptomyces erythrochromogenes]|uniref:hypothetical protein n=1 Tax=Streptomyces erythrochromogenes TaxID=285574 RepID=UPI003439D379
MDAPDFDLVRPTAEDTALLADDSLFARRLGALGSGGEGDRALGLLRDAHHMLRDPGRHHQPYVIAQSACRTAIECLMDLGGTDYEGLVAARNDLRKALKPIFHPDGARKISKPLARLLAALDALAEFPEALPAEGALREALVSLHRSRSNYRPALPDLAHAKSLEKVVSILDGLEQVPEHLTVKEPLAAALRDLHEVRPAVRRDSALERDLAVVGAAYARLLEMESAQGSRRTQQITALVQELHGREPGAGELKAYKAWSDYYQSASQTIHTASGSGPADAVKLLHDVLTVIRELVFTLPDQAAHWVELASVTSPTAEQVQEVNQLHHPSATQYLFTRFTGWTWLEKLAGERLLPEETRWPAAPYFQRLATEDPARLAKWLKPRLEEIGRRGTGATARLVRLCRHLHGHAAPLIAQVIKRHGLNGLQMEVLYWALEVDPAQRGAPWVEVVRQVLVTGAGTSPIAAWDVQSALAQLQESARVETSLAAGVRQALVDVLAAHLVFGGTGVDLQIRDDLRAPTLAGGPALTGAWLAAAACLEFARSERDRGVDLAARTGAWTSDSVGGWERDRLLAVHLLDIASDAPNDPQWWAATLRVLTRLDAMPVLTADVAAFVRTVVERCGPARMDDLEAALRGGLGPVPDDAALRAARTELEGRNVRLEQVLNALAAGDELPEWESQVPAVWRTLWALSPVLPTAAVAPWWPVVALLTEYAGTPPAVTQPLIKFLPLPDTTAEALVRFLTVCTENGAVHGATLLAGHTPTRGNYYERAEFRLLDDAVRADADAWATDIEAVVEALGTFDLRTVYLGALSTHRQAGGLADPDSQRSDAALGAAWQLMAQLGEGAGSVDPDLNERARRTTCQLLKDAWAADINPGLDENKIIPWLMAAAREWTTPTHAPDDPYVTAAATSGGMALIALVQWAVRRAAADGQLPTEGADLMTQILTERNDDRALAVIGAALTPLRLYAAPWYTTHQETLLNIAAAAAPVRSWLLYLQRLSPYDCAVLGDIDPADAASYLRTDPPQQVATRFATALLHFPDTFGPDFLAEVADGEGGPEAVSTLLGDIARGLPRDPADNVLHERGLALWDQVLDLAEATSGPHLPGAGHFAFADGLTATQWLKRTLRTVMINPDILFPDQVAARAARTAEVYEARLILARLLTLVDSPGHADNYRMRGVVEHARAVLDAAEPGSEGRAELGQALALHADDVEAATAE